MKKLKVSFLIALIAGGALMQSGCIGSFSLTKNVLEFNQDVTDNKFINEIVFLAFCIVPVYEVTVFVDAVILNLVEFWTGDNPLGYVNEKDELITLEKVGDEYVMKNQTTQEEMKVIVDTKTNTVYAFNGTEKIKLIVFNNANKEVTVFLPNSETKTVDLNTTTAADFRKELSGNYELVMN